MPAHFSWRRRHLITRSRSVVLRGHAGKARRADNLATVSGRVQPARSDAVRLLASPVVVLASRSDASCLSFVGPRIFWRVGGTRDLPIEVLFPEGRARFEVGSSGWSRVQVSMRRRR